MLISLSYPSCFAACEAGGAAGDIYQVAGSYNACGCVKDSVSAVGAELNLPYQTHVSVSGSTTTVEIADYGQRSHTAIYFDLCVQPTGLSPLFNISVAGTKTGGHFFFRHESAYNGWPPLARRSLIGCAIDFCAAADIRPGGDFGHSRSPGSTEAEAVDEVASSVWKRVGEISERY